MSQLSETAEKALCKIYRQSAENQKIELNLNTPVKDLQKRLRILNNQYPYDMEKLCERWGI
jgi:hypothetical protein